MNVFNVKLVKAATACMPRSATTRVKVPAGKVAELNFDSYIGKEVYHGHPS